MKKLLLSIIYLSLTTAVSAQNDTTAVRLNETVISATRTIESRKSVAQTVTVISRPAIEQINAQTTADLMQNTAGLFVQRSQQGGGSPVIRGFEASRVLMVVDGVRMNNAIFRSGHLQNIITMDNNTLERAEVLFGPASTVYGSDALGGAICFYTKKPVFSAKPGGLQANGGAFFRYGSVNAEKTGHVDLSLGLSRIALLTSFTWSDFDDLKMGKREGSAPFFGLREYYADRINGIDTVIKNPDPYVQKFSGYRQFDLMEKLAFRQNDNVLHTINVQFSNSSDIPRYDRLTETNGTPEALRYSDWYYGPQKRLLTAYQLVVNEAGWFNRGLQVTASYQDIGESRHSRRFGRPARRSQIEEVTVLGFTALAERGNEKYSFRLGVDAQHSDVTSIAFDKNLSTGDETPSGTRYPDGGSTMTDMAAFATFTQHFGKITLNEGLRGGYSNLRATFENRELFPFPFSVLEQKSPVGSGSVGAVFQAHKNQWQLKWCIALTKHQHNNFQCCTEVNGTRS